MGDGCPLSEVENVKAPKICSSLGCAVVQESVRCSKCPRLVLRFQSRSPHDALEAKDVSPNGVLESGVLEA